MLLCLPSRLVTGAHVYSCFTRYLLCLRPCPYLDMLSDSQMAKLLYRDTVQQKHGSRKRLASELKAVSETAHPPDDNGPGRLGDSPRSFQPLTRALTDYVLDATRSRSTCVQEQLFDLIWSIMLPESVRLRSVIQLQSSLYRNT